MESRAESVRDSVRGQDACPLVAIIYTKLLTRPSKIMIQVHLKDQQIDDRSEMYP